MGEDENIKSLSTEGSSQQKRIDRLNEIISYGKLHLKEINEETGELYFYDTIKAMYEKSMELTGYYTTEEEKSFEDKYKELKRLLKEKSPIKLITVSGRSKSKMFYSLDETNYDNFEDELHKFDKLIRKLYFKYDLIGIKQGSQNRSA